MKQSNYKENEGPLLYRKGLSEKEAELWDGANHVQKNGKRPSDEKTLSTKTLRWEHIRM